MLTLNAMLGDAELTSITSYTSFAKAVIGNFKLGDKTPKTCKTLYKYLKEKGYYEPIEKADSKRDREEDRYTI